MAFAFRRLVPAISFVRSFHSTPAALEMSHYDKFNFKMCSYRKYGLLRDDLWRDYDPVVKEALDRIPEKMYMERMYRSIRAQQLYLEHNILPEDQWTTLEDDHEYLMPYINEVEAELKERDEWERTH